MSADPTPGLPARRAALRAIAAVDDGAWSTTVVPESVTDLADERDRRFASHLAYDTIRWHGTLDWLLDHVLTRPMADVEPTLRPVLRLGALQLWRAHVPARAAVSTSVALAREAVPPKRARGAGGFVNGVLRALSRTLGEVTWPDASADAIAHLALTTGHPAWLVRERVDALGADDAARLLAADNAPPGLTLRAVGDRDALVAELRGHGLPAEPTGQAPQGVRVPGADPRRLACVAEGRAVPQDEASMLVVAATGARSGDRVLDLCAGPGGKTGDLAARVAPGGGVTAVEPYPHRADRVRDTLGRLGLAADLRVSDGREVVLDVPVDVALVDAPCSGLGTGRRRPEVRWRRSREDVDTLAALQVELVTRAADQVRAGGTLTYAVCTWTAGETLAVVERVERARPGLVRGASVQLRPDVDDTDGMFHTTWRVG